MGDEPATGLNDPEFAKLRKKFLEEKVFQYQPTLNAIEDPNWGRPVKVPIGDRTFEFKKFNHGETTLLTSLRYFPKLLAQQKLDEKEEREFHVFKRVMLERVAVEPNRWSEFTEAEPKWVDVVFNSLLALSQVDVKKLDDFFASDYGWNYGYVWFTVMGLTPTQVGALSESDYQAVNSWFRKNAERVRAGKK